jgi:hypothetical protein
MSEQMLREEARGGGQAPITAGRLQLRTMTVVYNNTAYFQSVVTPDGGRASSTKTFSNNLGGVSLESGKHRFMVLSNAQTVTIQLTSDSHLPCYFTSAEWEGHFTSRSQRA